MGWLILGVLLAGGLVIYMSTSSFKNAEPSRLAARISPGLVDEGERLRRDLDAETDRIRSEVDIEGAKIEAETRRAADAADRNCRPAPDVAPPRRGIWREDYVPKEDEDRYLTRKADSSPNLYLADAGDRLAIWSPVEGGGLINPKGPGIRGLGLYASYARGAVHHDAAYRAADLRKGQWIDLKREPENPHDKNAVALCTPGSRVPFAYVQRGRAPAVARRMDAGEDMAAVSLRGPAKGHDEETAIVLIGRRADLTAMLAG